MNDLGYNYLFIIWSIVTLPIAPYLYKHTNCFRHKYDAFIGVDENLLHNLPWQRHGWTKTVSRVGICAVHKITVLHFTIILIIQLINVTHYYLICRTFCIQSVRDHLISSLTMCCYFMYLINQWISFICHLCSCVVCPFMCLMLGVCSFTSLKCFFNQS